VAFNSPGLILGIIAIIFVLLLAALIKVINKEAKKKGVSIE